METIQLTSEQEGIFMDTILAGGKISIRGQNVSIVEVHMNEKINVNNLTGKKGITLQLRFITTQYFNKFIKNLYKENNDL